MTPCPHCKTPPRIVCKGVHFEAVCGCKVMVGMCRDTLIIEWDRWANGITKS